MSDRAKSRQKRIKRSRADKCKEWGPSGRGIGGLRIIEVDRERKPEEQTRH
ncbi:hypothetical protein [Halomonas denitrificans]|nr:hypothetical protein [Halomonas denitrificans]